MQKQKTKPQLNYETKTALFLMNVMIDGIIKPNPQITDKICLDFKDVLLTIERYVNTDYAKPHYVYTVRNMLGTTLYNVSMTEEIEDEVLHSKLAHRFHSITIESQRMIKKQSQNELQKFLDIESDFMKFNL